MDLEPPGHARYLRACEPGFQTIAATRRETRDPKMGRRWRCIGNTEVVGRPSAPVGVSSPAFTSASGLRGFGDATFRAAASEAERPRYGTGVFGSLIYRPMVVFRRNDVAWIAARAWRTGAKVDDVLRSNVPSEKSTAS
jgi:hypothetical protein